MRKRDILYIFFLLLFLKLGYGQSSEPHIIRALPVISPIKLDGFLDEKAWSQTQKISNFSQRELNEGRLVTERTLVGLVYTQKSLYIGVWCYDSEPDKLVAKEMKRDFNYYSEDNFKIIIDTYHDRRNAYLFIINPNGARADILSTDEGRNTNQLESVSLEWRPLGFGTKSGEWFEYNIQRFFDRLDESFEIHEGVNIPAGKYWFNRHEIQFSTFRGRKVSFGSTISWGGYYSGHRAEASLRVNMNINKHLNLSADYLWNRLQFSQGKFVTKEVGGRLEDAFTTKLYSRFFGQWNNEDKEILINFRLNWIPKIGSDFYLAVNHRISTANSRWKVEDTVILLKFVWRFSY